MNRFVKLSCLALSAAMTMATGAPPTATAPATQPASAPAPKPITLKLPDGVEMKLVLIPPGKFMMGSTPSGGRSEKDERPQREVTITRPFYLGVTEVTQRQYQAVMGANPSQVKAPDNPVDAVSWDEANEFCKKLSAATGRKARIPTEAEWEYACRAGTTTLWTFGSDVKDLDAYAWHSGNAGGASHPVAGKKPNPWGLYDMYGNVCEWCFDYHGSYAKVPKVDPTGPAEGNHRILRGGSWANPPEFCRSPNRAGAGPESKRKSLGFRVVVEPADPPNPAP
ncbi:MAG TPA: formylglycine-generating enzyme family protein [Phycisphaerae bacterium]|nr:formylglycine-generating enzyme family protein [Phycisphaerae bacterium]